MFRVGGADGSPVFAPFVGTRGYVNAGTPGQTGSLTFSTSSPLTVNFDVMGQFTTAQVVGVQFQSTGTLPGGISASTTYWLVPASTALSSAKIADSVAHALAGTFLSYSSSPTGTVTMTPVGNYIGVPPQSGTWPQIYAGSTHYCASGYASQFDSAELAYSGGGYSFGLTLSDANGKTAITGVPLAVNSSFYFENSLGDFTGTGLLQGSSNPYYVTSCTGSGASSSCEFATTLAGTPVLATALPVESTGTLTVSFTPAQLSGGVSKPIGNLYNTRNVMYAPSTAVNPAVTALIVPSITTAGAPEAWNTIAYQANALVARKATLANKLTGTFNTNPADGNEIIFADTASPTPNTTTVMFKSDIGAGCSGGPCNNSYAGSGAYGHTGTVYVQIGVTSSDGTYAGSTACSGADNSCTRSGARRRRHARVATHPAPRRR